MPIKRGRFHGMRNCMELLRKSRRIDAGQITIQPHSKGRGAFPKT